MTAKKIKVLTDTIAGECIAVRMRMLNRVVTNIYDDALRPLGLKVSQMNILVAAGKLGEARPRVRHLKQIGYQTTKTYVEYLGWLTKRTGMRGKAVDMFNQTVAVKDIQSLNEFIRKHMLESHNWREKRQRAGLTP